MVDKEERSSRIGVLVSLLLFSATLACCATAPESKAPVTREETCGVRISRIQVSAGGGFVDLRFRVLDPERASALLHPSSRATLIHEPTGKVLSVASSKLGNLRQSTSNPERGREYFILFRNFAGLVVPGDRVTFVAGACSIEGLEVE